MHRVKSGRCLVCAMRREVLLIERASLPVVLSSRRADDYNPSTHGYLSRDIATIERKLIRRGCDLTMRNKRPHHVLHWKTATGSGHLACRRHGAHKTECSLYQMLLADIHARQRRHRLEGCNQKSIEFIQAPSRCLLKQEVPEIKM